MHQEQKWIRKIQKKRDRTAADRLIHSYYDEIYVFVYRQMHDKELSMDLTQEIFIAMMQSIDRYHEKKAKFRTWLYRVATNKVIDYRRSQQYRVGHHQDLEQLSIPSEKEFVRALEEKELLEKVEQHVLGADLSSQEIFRLRIFGAYSFAEIAVICELPESTVKTKFYRILKLLRKEFTHEYEYTNAR